MCRHRVHFALQAEFIKELLKKIEGFNKFLPERRADTMSAQQSLDQGWEIDCDSVGCPCGLEHEVEGDWGT